MMPGDLNPAHHRSASRDRAPIAFVDKHIPLFHELDT